MRDKVMKGVSQEICDKIENGNKEFIEGESFKIDLMDVDGEKYALLTVQKHDWQTGKDSNIWECLMTEKDYKNILGKFHEVLTLNLV
ncbi:MAG: hypothetical protein NKF70_00155 [Methanobacterium sp. ERen5]|nr:MAG: hypothetical protein NKF70_00155 [Methanobacterium sp. ERen5]